MESDSITVVLFRSEMSLTQVPEARKVLRQWARAKESEQAQDVLRWRQRLGYRDSWMVSSEEDRRTILHRLLCCMWNGQVDVVDGDPASPDRVRLRLFPETGPSVPGVRLRLGDFPGGVSSWAELLRAYERWTVLDDERTVEDYCQGLMSAQPLGLARTGSEPHPLFVELVEKIAPHQLELLAERRERGGERVEGWVRPLWEFWAETLLTALDAEFGDQRAVQPTLRTLLEHVRGGTPKPRAHKEFPEPRRPVADDDDWGTSPGASSGYAASPSGNGGGGGGAAYRDREPYPEPERAPRRGHEPYPGSEPAARPEREAYGAPYREREEREEHADREPYPEPSARPDREPYRDRERAPYDPLAQDPDDDVSGGGSWRTTPQDRTDRPAPWDKDSRGRSTHRDDDHGDDDNGRYRRGFLDGDAE